MCKICVDYNKGSMTAGEALRAFSEVSTTEDHMKNFEESLSDEQLDEFDTALNTLITDAIHKSFTP